MLLKAKFVDFKCYLRLDHTPEGSIFYILCNAFCLFCFHGNIKFHMMMIILVSYSVLNCGWTATSKEEFIHNLSEELRYILRKIKAKGMKS